MQAEAHLQILHSLLPLLRSVLVQRVPVRRVQWHELVTRKASEVVLLILSQNHREGTENQSESHAIGQGGHFGSDVGELRSVCEFEQVEENLGPVRGVARLDDIA